MSTSQRCILINTFLTFTTNMNIKFLVLLALISFNILSGAKAQERSPLKAIPTDQDLTIDGKLNESAWNEIVPFHDFIMVEPIPGNDPTERTEIRISYNQKGICFAITSFDKEPGKISANTMEHDMAEERNEDQISILLDPFQDKRSAYIFIVNPRGAKSEGFASGEHYSLGWDGLWQAKCQITSDGWTAELFIPFKTISFNPQLSSWGINVERYIARKQEVIRYSGIDLNSFFSNPKEAGLMEGMNDVRQGLGLTIRPYGKVARVDNKTDVVKPDNSLKGGFDVYKSITPNLVGAVTVNTDFAETEVDARRLNLTRFPLYFPEKRTFFLEGSDIFEFGSTNSSTFLPFFSRRIGLNEGKQIPLNFGAKMFGKIGNTNLALLDVQSGSSEFIPSSNMFAARISQNIFEESKIGMILTNGSQTGEQNTLAGADFRYKTSRFMGNNNFSVDLWGTKNWGTKNWNGLEGGNKNAYGFKIDYPNDLVDAAITYTFIGDSLNAGLGFLPRQGFRSLNTNISYMPRLEKGWIGSIVRQWFFELRAANYWNLAGVHESMEIFTAPVNFRTESGEHIEFNVIPKKEVLPFDFEVAEGIFIPKGNYYFNTYRFEVNSAPYRKIQGDLSYRFGQFYDGHYRDLETALTLKAGGYANLQVGANMVRGYLPEGDFSENVWFSRINLYLSPDLGFSNYIQFDDVSNTVGYNGRFYWQISPGNIVYLVYNNNTARLYDPDRRFRLIEDQVMFKVQMTVRF